MKRARRLLGLAGLLAAFIAVPTAVRGQQPDAQTPGQHDHQVAGGAQTGGAMPRQGMMSADMMKMMSDMQARDEKIAALVQKMNAAKGAEKTDVMAALLTAIVEDREATRSMMMGMMHNMMGGAMGAHTPADQQNPKQ